MSELIKSAGLIGTFVLLCGILKFYVYYKQFNISILRFIEIGETITLFMDNLLGYIVMIIPTTLNFAYIYKSEEYNIYSSGYSVLEVFKGHWLLMMVMSAMLALYAFIYHHYGKGVKNLDLKLLLIFIVICMVGVPPLFVWVMRTYQHDFHQTLDAKALYLVFLGAMLTVFSIAAAMAETHKVKKQRFFSNVRVVLKNGASIHSTETLYFIGMTKNYFFIYDNRRKSCTVHRIESFETMVFEKS